MERRGTFLTSSWQFHVAFWIIYWGFGSLQDIVFHSHFRQNFNLPIVLGAVGVVYFNYYYWLPRWLIERKRYLFWGLSMVAIILANAFLVNLLVGSLIFHDDYYFKWQATYVMAIDSFVLVAFTTAFKFMQQWNERNTYAKELERKQLESELEMLKSQINPHFIFNTLNTIYFLIEQQDPKAKEVVLKFSDILSHQLYDYNKDFVDLSKEVEYLKNYIELQRLRHDEELLDLECTLPRNTEGYQIAPMLLIPFVENAFKHSPNSTGFHIRLSLGVDDQGWLRFHICNSKNPQPGKGGKSGIGLPNVRRRLELTYPNRHRLTIQDGETRYCADLQIQLK